ncbi:hypothetical protein HK405_014745 [Cladochytrium tenue]|nr:hypothetical protein HK405_014745 [Cladochytrium tenue]
MQAANAAMRRAFVATASTAASARLVRAATLTTCTTPAAAVATRLIGPERLMAPVWMTKRAAPASQPATARVTSTTMMQRRHQQSEAGSSGGGPPEFLVVSMIGKDRVGVVQDLAKYLASLGANVGESRMARLGGEFAVIVLIALKGGDPKTFLTKIQEVFPGFQVDGPDQTGIVYAVTEKLAKRGISIDSIETRTTPAAFAGYPMFYMKVECLLDEGAVALLKADFEQVEDKFGVQVEVLEVVDDD